jgi:hypothetical protein
VRKAVLIPLLALILAASASAAAQESPYRLPPTRFCMTRHVGDHHMTHTKGKASQGRFGFGQRYDAFTWNASGRYESVTRASTDLIGIEFAPSPARALASERRVRHILHAYYGYSATWIRRHLMRRANVVVAAYTFYSPLTAGQRRLIVGCLRR